MKTFHLTAYPAERDGPFVSIFISRDPIATRTVTARTTAEALAALDAFAADLPKDRGARASARLARGERAPSGWRKADTWRDVNL